MEKNRRIQILVSTYNGEKYLREQLNSFLWQDCFDCCRVLIRDDGSVDSTPRILEEYAKNSHFEVVFGENLGVNDSYQWLIAHSDPACDYFAFSDQDDVWLPQKLSSAMTALDAQRKEQPLLFASRSCITDAALMPVGKSAQPRRGISFYNAMAQNVLPGHTQVFNRALRDVLIDHGCQKAHVVDWWVYLTASAVGKIIFSETTQVLHRQHGDNSVGYQRAFFSQLGQRLRAVRQGKGNAVSRQLSAFRCSWDGLLPTDAAQELSAYLDSCSSVFARFCYLCRSRVYRQDRLENWAFRLFYLVGKYKL